MNIDSINRMLSGVDTDSKELDSIVDTLVSQCCEELDQYVMYIKGILDDQNNPITDAELDDFILTLPTLLYFAGTVQETMGIREDVAKMTESDQYHRVFMETEGTVANKQAMAKLQTQDHTLTTIVYQRASKKIKLRVEAAYEVLQSAKKVLSRRIAELEMSKTTPNRNQG